MSTLWHGRFEGGPAEELMAFTVSLPFDARLAADDITGSRAHVRGLARGGILTDAERDDVLAALDAVEAELAAGEFVVPALRRGHPHRGRAAGHRAGRPGRGQAPHRPQPQRPGRHRPAPVRQARAGRGGRAGARPPAGPPRPGGRGRRRLPARLHPPPAGPAGAAGPPPAGPRLGARPATSTGCADTIRRLDVSPLGAGALAGSSLPLDPAGTAADLGFAGVFANSLDAVSDRDFVAEALFDLALLGVHLSRLGRGDHPLVDRRVRLPRPRRRLLHRLVDAPAEEEPRHRRAHPGQDRSPHRQPHRPAGHAQGPAARLQPRPAGGQGAVLRLPRHRGAGPVGDDRPARLVDLPPRRHGRGRRRARRSRPPTWPSTWSPGACRSATPTPSSARSCAGSLDEGIALRELVEASPELGPDALFLLDRGTAVRRRTTPGGAGPEPVAAQLRRLRRPARRRPRPLGTGERAPAAPAVLRPRPAASVAPELLNKVLVARRARPPASSRSRPTPAPTTPAATPSGARRPAPR